MSEIPDRIPGGVILASYANDIRDRTLQRYPDPTARDASNPLPSDGELAWVESLDVIQVAVGGVWRNVALEEWANAITDPLAARITELEAVRDSMRTVFTEGSTTLGTSLGTITGTVTAPTDGLYLMELLCEATAITAGQTSLGGITVAANVNGSQSRAFSQFAVRHNDAGDVNVDAEWMLYAAWQQTLSAGDDVNWFGQRQATFTVSAAVADRRVTIRRLQ